MNAVKLNTRAEKELAAQCAKTILAFSNQLAPMALSLEAISEILQELSSGSEYDPELVLNRLDAAAPALEGFDAGNLEMAMNAAATLIGQALK
jgi:hypothetical protein